MPGPLTCLCAPLGKRSRLFSAEPKALGESKIHAAYTRASIQRHDFKIDALEAYDKSWDEYQDVHSISSSPRVTMPAKPRAFATQSIYRIDIPATPRSNERVS